MQFDLSDEQKQLQDSVDRVLTSLVDLNALANGASSFASVRDRLDEALSELGIPLVMVPEEQGGLGMGLLTLVAIAQHLGRHCAPTDCLETALGGWVISSWGSDAQRARWLPELIEGRASVTFAATGGSGAWAPGQWESAASDGRYHSHNVKVPQRSGLAIVGTARGLSVSQVSPEDFKSYAEPLDSSRPLGTISFQADALQPLCDRAGAWRVFEALAVLAAADAAGAGQRALEMASDYAKVRRQFGREIGSFQAIKHQLATMAVDILPAHFTCWYGAHAWDLGLADARRTILLAKAHATDMAVKTARAAVECHGGIAYTWEYPLHLLLKRAMQDRVTWSDPIELRRLVAAIDDVACA